MTFSYYPGVHARAPRQKRSTAAAACRRRRWAWSLRRSKTGSAAVRCIRRQRMRSLRACPPCARWMRRSGQDQKLLTLCSACHHVIKRVNEDMRSNEYIRTRANNYLKLAEPYAGETQVVHYLEMLRDDVGFDAAEKSGQRSRSRA